MTDMVNHPVHYNDSGAVECIDAIRSALTEEEFRGMLKGNIMKYVWRERRKGGDEDLAKARWYLNVLLLDYDEARDRALGAADFQRELEADAAYQAWLNEMDAKYEATRTREEAQV